MSAGGRALVMLLALGLGAPAGVCGVAPDAERIVARVRTLTAPELAGRGSGTPELRAAADTLTSWLRHEGLQPAFAGRWTQEFALTGEGWAGQELDGGRDLNVAGILPGSGDLAARYVVVGAHYDHLGRVAPAAGGGAVPDPLDYYPGANDNASGVSVVCEMIALSKAHQDEGTDRRSVLFVFFGGEEVGLQGSGHFVSRPPIDLSLVDAMVNFDTVGQINDDRLYVSGLGTTAIFADLVAAANTDQLQLTLGQGGWSGSDHMSFNTREVPVLFVFGGPYRQYNRPSDTYDKLTPAGMVRVVGFGARLLESLRTTPGPLPWVMVAQKVLREGEAGQGNRDTWFGSLPDFTEDAQGYPLAGVFDNSPAARAGLQKGDLLVRMAGQAVADLAGFTRVLRAHSPGDLVEVEVLRDGKPLRFTVVMGNRADRE